MLVTFFEVKGVILKEFVPSRQTVNAANYVEVLGRLRKMSCTKILLLPRCSVKTILPNARLCASVSPGEVQLGNTTTAPIRPCLGYSKLFFVSRVLDRPQTLLIRRQRGDRNHRDKIYERNSC